MSIGPFSDKGLNDLSVGVCYVVNWPEKSLITLSEIKSKGNFKN